MKFDTIVILIIAFNVIAALVSRRAKKKASAADTQPVEQTSASPEKIVRGRSVSPEAVEEEFPGAEWEVEEHAESSPAPKGGGFLDQLARELGLKLPEPEPMPSPAILTEDVRPSRGDSRSLSVVEGRIAPTKSVTLPPPVQLPPQESNPAFIQRRGTPSPVSGLSAQLRHPHRIQEAWLLKEILERPVALRR